MEGDAWFHHYSKPISAAVCNSVGLNSTEGRTRNLSTKNQNPNSRVEGSDSYIDII
jgi:hypothetical protein